MTEETLLELARMFEEANKIMAEMVALMKDMSNTLSNVKNPWPDYLREAGGGGHRRAKARLRNAEVPWRELKYKREVIN